MTVYRVEQYSEVGKFWGAVRYRGKSFFFDEDKAREFKALYEKEKKRPARVIEEEMLDGDIIKWKVLN